LAAEDKVILFFGTIAPYKGLEYLLAAFNLIASNDPTYRLVIAGRPRRGSEDYWREIEAAIRRSEHASRILQTIEFVRDDQTELYFKAADVVVLPYLHIFQSGVLFLAYSFGVPVIATDVGDLKEDVLAGDTGFVCKPANDSDLAGALTTYFSSELFWALPERRARIRDYAVERHSWETVAALTTEAYSRLLGLRSVPVGSAVMAGVDASEGE
jgi:glycosyltransferase involved in cell wall biosynthesis